jgi:hypothetical protein
MKCKTNKNAQQRRNVGIKEVRILQMATVKLASTCGTAAILQSPLYVLQTDAKTPQISVRKQNKWQNGRSSAHQQAGNGGT